MTRRGKLEITKNILEVCKTSAKKTTIVYQCNLNFYIIKKYLEGCFNNGWIQKQKIGSRDIYTTTQLGEHTLEILDHSLSLVNF